MQEHLMLTWGTVLTAGFAGLNSSCITWRFRPAQFGGLGEPVHYKIICRGYETDLGNM